MKVLSLSHALTVLILVLFAVCMNSNCLLARPMPNETNTKFIKTACGATTYPDLCFTTLSIYATEIQAKPKLLAIKALSVTLKTTKSTSTMITNLSKSQELAPRDSAAMQDCVEELIDSVDELHRSISEMVHNGGKNFSLQISDIQTWVSAALTDEDTCMDGFSENSMNENVKTTVRSHIVNVAHMTSNALALINNYASTTSH